MSPEQRDDDLTPDEYAQLAALERTEGPRKAAGILCVTALQVIDALARKPLAARPKRCLILGLERLRPPDLDPGPDKDLEAMLRGHAIVVALQAQRKAHSE